MVEYVVVRFDGVEGSSSSISKMKKLANKLEKIRNDNYLVAKVIER